MSRLLTFPAGRRAKWIVVAVWLAAVVATLALGLPGQLADAEENSSTSFLPGDAESTAALAITQRLQGARRPRPWWSTSARAA